MRLSGKLVVIILLILGIVSTVALIMVLWTEEPLKYGLVYHHPVGNWTHVSKIHWLGSPSQFEQVNSTGSIESDIAKISKAGYKSILFHTCIACLNRTAPPYNDSYSPDPTDFNYPDSSAPEDLGLVQTPDETLPSAEKWKQICQVSIISDIAPIHVKALSDQFYRIITRVCKGIHRNHLFRCN